MSDEQSQTSPESQLSQALLPAVEPLVEPSVAPAAPGVAFKSPVRLRKPERSQVKMRICCDDDLIRSAELTAEARRATKRG